MPVARFGQSFVAWQGHDQCVRPSGPYRGRDCAAKMSPEFRYMEADLYNLRPAIGELNAVRSNLPPGEVAGEARVFGRCDFEVDKVHVEPRPKIRGDVARIYLYMDAAYPGRGIIQAGERGVFERWSKHDPVDEHECAVIRRIVTIQRNVNEVVEQACEKAGL